MATVKVVTLALAATVLSGGLSVSPALASHPEQQPGCIFDKFGAVAVAPYMTENSIDFGSYSFLGGAQLFVPAREGLTKEWLTASVEDALASAHLTPKNGAAAAKALCDSPKVKDVHVRVVSAGNGFWVQLIGRDARTSEILLKWARSIVDPRKPGAKAER